MSKVKTVNGALKKAKQMENLIGRLEKLEQTRYIKELIEAYKAKQDEYLSIAKRISLADLGDSWIKKEDGAGDACPGCGHDTLNYFCTCNE
jgi:hypothetical protein